MKIMKKTTNFRKMAIAVMLAIACVGANAQYVGPSNATYVNDGTSDYVTIGSRMPYYVAPDPIIAALQAAGAMDYSQFAWQMTTMASVSVGITPATYLNAALTAGGAAGYYTQNEISVIWSTPNVAVGSEYEVQVTEHSVPLSGIFAQGCVGNTTTKDIFVIARPTIAFTLPIQENYPCGTAPGPGTIFYVPVSVTGIGPWKVTYNVTYNGGGPQLQSNIPVGVAPGETDANVFITASTPTLLAGTPTAAVAGLPVTLNGGGATNGYGVYVVTVTNITDAISEKSLDPALIAAQATDLPQAPNATYSIYISPTPTTQPIQHLPN